MTSYHPLLKGAIELHCHSYPSIFPRKQTDWELIEDVKKAGMAGVVLKAHEMPTVDRAALIREKEPGLHVYGGLVCNHFTGGLSPAAVDVAIRMGAKIIWMPTISAREHQCHFGRKKTRLFQTNRPLIQPETGLSIWDEDRAILPEVHEILSLIGEAGIILATGHLHPEEVLALVDAAKEHRVEKILIQHADLGIAPVPFQLQKELSGKGAILEKCYMACGPDFHDLTAAEMAESIKRLGADVCVMVTDFGQAHNIPPVQAMSEFVELMLAHGITESEIEQMIVDNPKQLLGI